MLDRVLDRTERFKCLGLLVCYMDVNCPSCEYEGSRLGHHWSMSQNCSEPEFSDRQHQVITGILLGDGSVTTSDGRKPMFSVEVNERRFVEWVSDELGVFSTHNIIERKFEDKQNTYRINSRRLNQLKEYRSWYETGEKRFPENLELTPLVLKLWYCTDGGKSVDKRWKKKEYARIASKNESDRKEFILSLFDELPFDANWNDEYRFTFGRKGSYDFWDYIGDPLPGYEYKWPDDGRPEHLCD